jgi:hypothetical protein
MTITAIASSRMLRMMRISRRMVTPHPHGEEALLRRLEP